MITAHVLVKNEARFIWYSVMSVMKHVDRIQLWDTGSTDQTLEIVKKMRETKEGREKIYFTQWTEKKFDEEKARQMMLDEFGLIRQQMLEATKPDWFIVVDGDEIWWDSSIRKLIAEIKLNGEKLDSIIVPTVNLIGDIFHYQDKSAGKYKFGKLKGHYAIRAVNRDIPGLKSSGGHGVWGWADGEGKMIQDRDPKKMKFLNTPYMHATHLERAGDISVEKEVLKRSFKRKHELGIPFVRDFYYPEVFFRKRPDIVPNVWKNMDLKFKIRSFFETPLRKINRKYLPEKIGY